MVLLGKDLGTLTEKVEGLTRGSQRKWNAERTLQLNNDLGSEFGILLFLS